MINVCAKCGSKKIVVIDSRDTGEYVRRRRRCEDCDTRFTTREIRVNKESRFVPNAESETVAKRLKMLEVDFINQIKNYVGNLSADEQVSFFDEIIK